MALDGAVLVAGRTRLGVGRAGDLVGLGDWDCDGEVTAALARPSTGEVFVFDAWARPDEPVTVEATAVVARPRTLATAPADDGCDDLAVTDSAGRRHLIDLEEAR